LKVNKRNSNDLQNLYLFKNSLIENTNTNSTPTLYNNKPINNQYNTDTSNNTNNIQNDSKTGIAYIYIIICIYEYVVHQ